MSLDQVTKYSVCVGIPFHDGCNLNHLRESIDSIINQTYPINEIHLIQDGSVKGEYINLVKGYLKEHSNIKHIVIEKNGGLPYALNYSILKSKSEYYLRMDSDDISVSNRLEELINEIKKDDSFDVIGSTITEFYGDTLEKSIKDDKIKTLKVPKTINEIRRAFHYRAPLYHVTVIFKKTVFAKSGLYNIKYRRTEDLELWSRMLKNKDIKIKNIDKSLVYVRAADFVYSRSSIKSIFRQFKARFKYNTWSPWLNILKISSICFRILPKSIRKWAYKRLR